MSGRSHDLTTPCQPNKRGQTLAVADGLTAHCLTLRVWLLQVPRTDKKT